MRIVEATVHDGKGPALESVYHEVVIPSLEKTEGCLFAGLLQGVEEVDAYISLTLWKSEMMIQNYIDSGNYEKNLDQVRPWLESGSEWKIQLTKDDTLEYGPVSNGPVVKSFPVEAGQNEISEKVTEGRSYLRVLSLKVKPGKEQEFKKIYYSDIQKELEKTKGCRVAFLVDNSENDNEMLSFTIWDSLESVAHYENEGIFDRLLNKTKSTLDNLYQWKLTLEKNPKSSVTVTSRDIGISKFTLVVGKKFN